METKRRRFRKYSDEQRDTFIREIRAIRGDRSQREFAQLLGMTRAHITNIESGRRVPSYGFLQLLLQCEAIAVRSKARLIAALTGWRGINVDLVTTTSPDEEIRIQQDARDLVVYSDILAENVDGQFFHSTAQHIRDQSCRFVYLLPGRSCENEFDHLLARLRESGVPETSIATRVSCVRTPPHLALSLVALQNPGTDRVHATVTVGDVRTRRMQDIRFRHLGISETVHIERFLTPIIHALCSPQAPRVRDVEYGRYERYYPACASTPL